MAFPKAPIAAQPNTAPITSQPSTPVTRIVAPSGSPTAFLADYIAKGKNDDRVINHAIISLLPTGGRVLLLEGTFNLSAAIVLYNNVSLIGLGNGPQLFLSNNSNISAIINDDAIRGNYGITLDNLHIIGNKAGQTSSSGIHFRHVSSCFLSNLEIKEAKNSGIDLLAGSTGNTLKNIKVTNNGNNGLVISQSNYNQVSGLLAENNGDGGLWIFEGESNTLSGVYTSYNKFSGIEIEANNNTLANIISTSNAHSGVYMTQASRNHIQGLAINNTLSGFALNTSNGNTLKVWAVENGQHGIDLYNSSSNSISESVFRSNGRQSAGFAGIHISSNGDKPSNYNMIVLSYALDNQVQKTQEFGIKIDGSADYTLIMGNDLRHNKFGPLSVEPRHNVIVNNVTVMP